MSPASPPGADTCRRVRRASACAVVVAASAVAGCQQQGSDRGAAPQQPGASASSAPTVRTPRLSVVGVTSGRIGAGAPIRLTVTDGRLRGAPTVSPALAGAAAGDTGWSSTAETKPSTTYRLTANVVDAAGKAHRITAAVATTSSDATLRARLTPGDEAVVGIGMPVTVLFNRTVATADRKAVEARLQVRTQRPLTGAWHWLTSKEVHFRPVRYWPTREAVQVRAELPGLYLKGGVWGGARRTSAFRIGAAHVSIADVRAHRFTVYSDGKKLRSYPASMGSNRFPSKGGVHIALEMARSVTMDSSTIGIPRNGPGGYYKTVLWDVRISYGGAFVHAAPWSTGSQGEANVSHGCVNLSTSAARWFYGFTQRGDIVNVTNARVGPDAYDPGTADWNMSWARWIAGSATGARSTA